MLAETLATPTWPTSILTWCRNFVGGLRAVEIGEVALLAAGGLLLLAGATIISLRRSWRRAFKLPGSPEHALEPLDLLVGFLAIWILPSLFLTAAGLFGGAADGSGVPAATQATSAPGADVLPGLGSTIGQAGGQLAAVLFLLAIGASRVRGGLPAWGLSAGQFGRRLARAILVFIAIWPVCYGMLHLTRLFLIYVCGVELPLEHVALLVLQSSEIGAWTKAAIAVSAILLAPLLEELFFRGLLQSALAQWSGSPWIGVAGAGLAFGAMHLRVFDTVPTMAVFGGVLAFTYARTRSLTLVILIHAIFNGKNVLLAVLMS